MIMKRVCLAEISEFTHARRGGHDFNPKTLSDKCYTPIHTPHRTPLSFQVVSPSCQGMLHRWTVEEEADATSRLKQ
jgi:hypothetical protein